MKIIQTTSLTLDQKQSAFELWNSEYPEKIGYPELSEFENYLDGLSNEEHYLVVDDQNQILGWAFAFFREEEIGSELSSIQKYREKDLVYFCWMN
ncbi:hypothetical protein [Flavobacterium laiguense]|uniref:hypothetical protein n=1 Tax=Flavobacterium laiguense TaxID=2169409 RepID=UPI001CB8BAB2|nr:hypothetical protein [Flavobacterium laiguense]